MHIETILQNAGYKTLTGAGDVLKAIQQVAEGDGRPLCSGYKVLPDGTKCEGCKDCGQ